MWQIINVVLFYRFTDIENNYRSDGNPDDAQPTDNLLYSSSQHQSNDSPNISNRSPLQLRQASPFPLESTNSRRMHYVNPQERLRSSGKLKKKTFKIDFN